MKTERLTKKSKIFSKNLLYDFYMTQIELLKNSYVSHKNLMEILQKIMKNYEKQPNPINVLLKSHKKHKFHIITSKKMMKNKILKLNYTKFQPNFFQKKIGIFLNYGNGLIQKPYIYLLPPIFWWRKSRVHLSMSSYTPLLLYSYLKRLHNNKNYSL